MNPQTVDLDSEQFLTESQRQWLLGLVRCHLLGWSPAERSRFQKKVSVIRTFTGRSAWYAECRAFQVLAALRKPEMPAPLAILPQPLDESLACSNARVPA